MINKTNLILYVKDQQISRDFYEQVLRQPPTLDVPGMTEFRLSENTTLGLMPAAGICRLLAGKIPDPRSANGVPGAELYLSVADPATWHQRALQAGGRELQPLMQMNWGDQAAYSSDPDGNVLAFASSVSDCRPEKP